MSITSIKFDPQFIPLIRSRLKWQTRRPLELDSPAVVTLHNDGGLIHSTTKITATCPYGGPGDLLVISGTDITLKITDLRVEHLRDISDDDLIAEGFRPTSDRPPLAQFVHAWCQFYGPRPWLDNAHIWVIEFEVVKEKFCCADFRNARQDETDKELFGAAIYTNEFGNDSGRYLLGSCPAIAYCPWCGSRLPNHPGHRAALRGSDAPAGSTAGNKEIK